MFSKWRANKDMSIGIGSHSRNPNTTSLPIPNGAILTWDGDAPNGNVWFYATIDGVKHRGKIECGRITNLIKDNEIELVDNGDNHIVYEKTFLERLLNR
jgi:hypothetical protein